jgi:hypothetical protein
MNDRMKVVVALVLLVLLSAVGLKNLATAQASDAPIVVAHGGGPVPPPPWQHGGGPVPPPPWQHGGGPVPPPPWR